MSLSTLHLINTQELNNFDMRHLFLLLLINALIIITSCGGGEPEIDEPDLPDVPLEYDIDFNFSIKDNFQVTGETSIELSFDEGNSWVAPLDTALEEKSMVWARINNSEHNLDATDFNIDWSGSTIQPSAIENNIAKFVIDTVDIQINVELEILFRLIVSGLDNESNAGGLYELSLTDASKTLLGDSIQYNAKSMGYDPIENMLYLVHDGVGQVFRDMISKFDPGTKETTTFYDGSDIPGGAGCGGWNDAQGVESLGEEILAVGGCEGDDIFYFDKSNGASNSTPGLSRNTGIDNVYLDLDNGMLLSNSGTEIMLGALESDYRQQTPILRYGILKNSPTGEFVDFVPLDFSEVNEMSADFDHIADMTMTHTGVIYAIIESKASIISGPIQYLATIDPSNGKVNDIGVVSTYSRGLSLLHGLAYVPKYAVK